MVGWARYFTMRILKRILVGLAIFMALFFLIGSMLPTRYETERSIVISAPVEKVFDQVNDLKKNENWSPWIRADDTMKLEFGSQTTGQGAHYSWTSENSGSGKLAISKSVANERIETDIDFIEQGKASGYWKFEPSGETVKVTWGFYGENEDVLGRYFGLMMDTLVGADFEKGLAELKRVSEG